MARRTVHIPDDLDERIQDLGGLDDSYSSIVQVALREWAERQESETAQA